MAVTMEQLIEKNSSGSPAPPPIKATSGGNGHTPRRQQARTGRGVTMEEIRARHSGGTSGTPQPKRQPRTPRSKPTFQSGGLSPVVSGMLQYQLETGEEWGVNQEGQPRWTADQIEELRRYQKPYLTKLTKKEEKRFKEETDWNDDPRQFFDARGQWKKLGWMSEGQHGSSQFKLHGHPRTWMDNEGNAGLNNVGKTAVNTKTGKPYLAAVGTPAKQPTQPGRGVTEAEIRKMHGGGTSGTPQPKRQPRTPTRTQTSRGVTMAEIRARHTSELRDIGQYDQDTGAIGGIKNSIHRGLVRNLTAANVYATIGGVDRTEAIADLVIKSESLPMTKDQMALVDKSGLSRVFHILFNPFDVLAPMFFESAAQFGPALAASAGIGAAVGAAVGPAGSVAGTVVGAGAAFAGRAAASAYVESGAEILSLLSQQGVDTTNPEQLRQAFADPNVINDIKRRAAIKGITIGAFDAASFKLASAFKPLTKLTRGKGLPRRSTSHGIRRTSLAALEAYGVQAASGGGGELAGQVLSGAEINLNDIIDEIVLEGPGAFNIAASRVIQANQRNRRREDRKAARDSLKNKAEAQQKAQQEAARQKAAWDAANKRGEEMDKEAAERAAEQKERAEAEVAGEAQVETESKLRRRLERGDKRQVEEGDFDPEGKIPAAAPAASGRGQAPISGLQADQPKLGEKTTKKDAKRGAGRLEIPVVPEDDPATVEERIFPGGGKILTEDQRRAREFQQEQEGRRRKQTGLTGTQATGVPLPGTPAQIPLEGEPSAVKLEPSRTRLLELAIQNGLPEDQSKRIIAGMSGQQVSQSLETGSTQLIAETIIESKETPSVEGLRTQPGVRPTPRSTIGRLDSARKELKRSEVVREDARILVEEAKTTADKREARRVLKAANARLTRAKNAMRNAKLAEAAGAYPAAEPAKEPTPPVQPAAEPAKKPTSPVQPAITAKQKVVVEKTKRSADKWSKEALDAAKEERRRKKKAKKDAKEKAEKDAKGGKTGVPSGQTVPDTPASETEISALLADAASGDPVGAVGSVPFMITAGMKRALRLLGFGGDQIKRMRPGVAHEHLQADPRTRGKFGRPGFVDIGILEDIVTAAVRAGRFTATQTAAAARWLSLAAGKAIKTVGQAAKRLISEFGRGIAKFVNAIYKNYLDLSRAATRRRSAGFAAVGPRKKADAEAAAKKKAAAEFAAEEDAADAAEDALEERAARKTVTKKVSRGIPKATPEEPAAVGPRKKEAASDDLWAIPGQEFTSGPTSINKAKVPAVFNNKEVSFKSGEVNADIGGGKYDTATEFLEEKFNVENIIVDPFNQTEYAYQQAVDIVRGGQVDTATVSNVLNVIKEPSNRLKTIAQAADAIKPEGSAYFTVYQSKDEGQSGKDKWQEGRPLKDYVSEVEQHFGNVEIRNEVIIAKEPKKAVGPRKKVADEATAVTSEQDRKYMAAVKAGDTKAAQRMVDEAAKKAGYKSDQPLFHGTTHKFTVFNKDLSSIEGDLGAAYYFTNSRGDVDTNYAGVGPDLTGRIERLAESLIDDETVQDSYGKPIRPSGPKISGKDIGVGGYLKDFVEFAEGVARKRLSGGEERVIKAYVRLDNPAVIGGGKETSLEMTQEVDAEGEFVGEPTGTLVDFAENLREEMLESELVNDSTAQEVIGDLFEASDFSDIGLAEAIKTLKTNNEFSSIQDVYTDELAGNEIIRKAIGGIGHDGIIDGTVDTKFGSSAFFVNPITKQKIKTGGMAGITPSTVHVVAFQPDQIKSADPITRDGEGNVIPLSQRFDPTKPSILYSEAAAEGAAREETAGRFYRKHGRMPKPGDTLEEAMDGLILSKEQQALWKVLLPILRAQTKGTPKLTVGKVGKTIFGFSGGRYNSGTHTIKISSSIRPERAAKTMLHEAVHAATRNAIVMQYPSRHLRGEVAGVDERSRAAFARLEEIHRLIGVHPGAKGKYGSTNVLEMITEAFTTPDFQRFMSTVKVPGSTKYADLRGKNLLQSFIDAVKRLLNIRDKGALTALEEVLELGTTIMEGDIAAGRGVAPTAPAAGAGVTLAAGPAPRKTVSLADVERATEKAFAAVRKPGTAEQKLKRITPVTLAMTDILRVLAGEPKAALSQERRDQISEIIKPLPPSIRGMFTRVLGKKTISPADVKRVAKSSSVRSIRKDSFESVRRVRKVTNSKKIKGGGREAGSLINFQRRDKLRLADLLARSEQHWRNMSAKDVTIDQLTDLAIEIESIRETVDQIVKETRADKRATTESREAQAAQDASNIVDALDKAGEKTKQFDPARNENRRSTFFMRLWRGSYDVDMFTRFLEDGKGYLHKLFHVDAKTAEMRKDAADRDVMRELQEIILRHTGKSYSDIKKEWDASSAEGAATFDTVTIDGKDAKLLRGNMITIAALDNDTVKQLVAGRKFKLSEGTQRLPNSISEQEISDIRDRVEKLYPGMIKEIKAKIIQKNKRAVLSLVYQLTGKEPVEVDDTYLPREVNIEEVEAIKGIKLGDNTPIGTQIVTNFAENASLTKERSNDISNPITIRPFLSIVERHVEQKHKILHLSEIVTRIDTALHTPSVMDAINRRGGESAVKQLRAHLISISQARLPVSDISRGVRQAASNVTASIAVANPRMHIIQFGGIAKLWSVMPNHIFAAGLRGFTEKGLMERFYNAPGVGWMHARHRGGIQSRFSPTEIESQRDVFDTSDFKSAVGGFYQQMAYVAKAIATLNGQNAARGTKDLLLKSGVRLVSTIKTLNALDSVIARIAFAGYLAESKQKNPGFTREQHDTWVAERATDAMRSSQNSSSAYDMAGTVVTGRQSNETFLAMLHIFTSDSFKSLNMLHKGMADGKTSPAAMKALAGVIANAAWYSAVGGLAMSVAFDSLSEMFGDDDELTKIKRQAERWEKAQDRWWRGIVGQVSPVIGDRLLSAFQATQNRYMKDQVTGVPLTDVVGDLRDGFISVLGALEDMGDPEKEKVFNRAIEGLAGLTWSASRLFANPAVSLKMQLRSINSKIKEGPGSAVEYLREIQRDLQKKNRLGTISQEEFGLLDRLNKDVAEIGRIKSLGKKEVIDQERVFDGIRTLIRDYERTPTLEGMLSNPKLTRSRRRMPTERQRIRKEERRSRQILRAIERRNRGRAALPSA